MEEFYSVSSTERKIGTEEGEKEKHYKRQT